MALAMAASTSIFVTGCGTPGAPQAPSLRLPLPAEDLTASRSGKVVTLHWTMPRKTTDHLQLTTQVHGPIPARICTRLKPLDPCQVAGQAALNPGVETTWEHTLPDELAAGEPRPLTYSVELQNAAGQSAGPSNFAAVVAGAAPPAIEGLAAEVQAKGVTLHWQPSASGQNTAVRLHRTLLNPPAAKAKKNQNGTGKGLNMAGDSSEPLLRDLLVEPETSHPNTQGATQVAKQGATQGALDKTAHFGREYEYTAQRIQKLTVDGKQVELDGAISTPVRVRVLDTFPPAVPEGLAAVAVSEEKSIDLSWQPDTEEDLAGYLVYRSSTDARESGWTRISGTQPLAGPAYRDTSVEAGHSYRYAVTAIDLTGHESKRSAEAEETLPRP